MLKGHVPSTHHANNATWSKQITDHRAVQMENPYDPAISEIITNWPEGKCFGLSSEDEEDWVACAKEATI